MRARARRPLLWSRTPRSCSRARRRVMWPARSRLTRSASSAAAPRCPSWISARSFSRIFRRALALGQGAFDPLPAENGERRRQRRGQHPCDEGRRADGHARGALPVHPRPGGDGKRGRHREHDPPDRAAHGGNRGRTYRMIRLAETIDALRPLCGSAFGCQILSSALAYGLSRPFAQFWTDGAAAYGMCSTA